MDSNKIYSPATRRSKLNPVDNKFNKKERKDGGLFSPREESKNPLMQPEKKRKNSEEKQRAPKTPNNPPRVKDEEKFSIGENLRR